MMKGDPMNKKFNIVILTVVILIICLGGVLFLVLRKSGQFQRNINVILISVDAARADRLSCYGYPISLTPNIDRLASEGVIFRQAYCFGGSTTSSMGVIFTSRFPYWPLKVPGGGPRWAVKHHFGYSRFQDIKHLKAGIPDSLETMSSIFKSNGYTTVGISTNPYLTRDFNFNRGFDFFEEFSSNWRQLYPGVETVFRKMEAYLAELNHKKFFIWIHLMDLHHPLRDFEPFLEDVKLKGNHPKMEVPPMSEWTQEAVNILKGFASQHIPNWQPGEEGLQQALDYYIRAYEAELLRVDKQIGLLIDKLDKEGLRENTLLILVNDHGEEFAEHRYWDHRGQLYQAIVRAIWIMHCPQLFSQAIEVKQPVSEADLLPTLIDLLGLKGKNLAFDGQSCLGLLKGKSEEKGRIVFGLLDRRAYIIDGDYKLMINGDYGKKVRGANPDPPFWPVELYNLKDDPAELHNLAQQYPQIVDRLTIKLKQAFLEKGIRLWQEDASKEISQETKQRLKSLGYIK